MKKSFLFVTTAMLFTVIVNYQDKSDNAARDQDRQPTLGKANQRGAVTKSTSDNYKELNEADKDQNETIDKYFPRKLRNHRLHHFLNGMNI